MRDPLNLQEVPQNDEKVSIIKISNLPEYDIPDYNLSDSKDFDKYVNDIKKIVRGSFEYQRLIQFLRVNMNMNKCSFYENIKNIDTSKIKIHIHHDPFDIESIIRIVIRKRQTLFESLDDQIVAKEVALLHYNLLVGLIPLSETVHELVHNQYLFVPTTAVMGKYKEFVAMYEPYIIPEQLDILARIEEFTEKFNMCDYYNLLDRHYIYIDPSGAYKLPSYEDMSTIIKSILSNPPKPQQKLTNPIYFLK